MNSLMAKWFGQSWRTTLTGIVSAALAVPQVVTALIAWSNHQPVNWREALVAVAMAVGGTGLVAAKDKQVHSTQDQVQQATQVRQVEAAKDAGLPPKP